ncbi:MAG: ankyrin repeat domain-containing protein [Terriglobales bacterium]|jgi:ankyrin repeat protein
MENSQRCFELLQSGDAEALGRLLDEDPESADARDANGACLLMQCIYRGRRDLAETIADKKKTLDIFEAASLGRLDSLRDLARDSAALNSRSADGFTALHFACFFGPPESARLLIEAGAAVDAVAANPMQVMPLHSAASVRNLEAARLLLAHGAPPNARQQAGWAPIHAAAQNGDKAMVELLLQHRADPKQANDEGKTPAMAARAKGYEELAALLEK